MKAKAQIEVYKEIYNMDDDNSTKTEKKDTALKILQTAEENDVEKINKFFEKQNEFE